MFQEIENIDLHGCNTFPYEIQRLRMYAALCLKCLKLVHIQLQDFYPT